MGEEGGLHWGMLSMGVLGGGGPYALGIKFWGEDLGRGERSGIIRRGGEKRTSVVEKVTYGGHIRSGGLGGVTGKP